VGYKTDDKYGTDVPISSSFNGDVSRWNTSMFKDMTFIFQGAWFFKQVLCWNTSVMMVSDFMLEEVEIGQL